ERTLNARMRDSSLSTPARTASADESSRPPILFLSISSFLLHKVLHTVAHKVPHKVLKVLHTPVCPPLIGGHWCALCAVRRFMGSPIHLGGIGWSRHRPCPVGADRPPSDDSWRSSGGSC